MTCTWQEFMCYGTLCMYVQHHISKTTIETTSTGPTDGLHTLWGLAIMVQKVYVGNSVSSDLWDKPVWISVVPLYLQINPNHLHRHWRKEPGRPKMEQKKCFAILRSHSIVRYHCPGLSLCCLCESELSSPVYTHASSHILLSPFLCWVPHLWRIFLWVICRSWYLGMYVCGVVLFCVGSRAHYTCVGESEFQ